MLSRVTVQSIRRAAKGVRIENPSADLLPWKGVDWAKEPVKVQLEAGKTYAWCACGLSNTQPFCDGSHKPDGLTMLRPVRFQVEKSGEYTLCACKASEHRPLCDGNHKTVSQRPKQADARVLVMHDRQDIVYEGVARRLGYYSRDGYQQ